MAQLSDAAGWADNASYWSTLFSAGGCVPLVETCNGRDDDCDQNVDEGLVCEAPDASVPIDAGQAVDAGNIVDAANSDAGAAMSEVPPGAATSIHVSSQGCGCRGIEGPLMLLVLLLSTRRRLR